MTREEAIKHLLHDWYINPRCEFTIKSGRLNDFLAALDLALSALRPVSREQVEKVWRGDWNDIKPGVLKPNISWVCRCAKCGCPQDYKHNFYPNCGAAQTDKAIQMVMERFRQIDVLGGRC